jgi:hypothetical protein
MRVTTSFIITVLLTQLLVAAVDIETKNFSITLTDTGQWQSIVQKANHRQVCYTKAKTPFAQIGSSQANSAKMVAGKLEIGFAGSDTVLVYKIDTTDDWILFEVAGVRGTRPNLITMCQLPVNITENIGPNLNIAWDKETAVCLMVANLLPDAKATDKKTHALLVAKTQDFPGPKLEGSAVTLIVTSRDRIKKVLSKSAHVFGLPINEDADGVSSRQTLGKRSYWFMRASEPEADKIIEICKKTNIKQFLIVFPSWARTAGTYAYNTKYFPEGLTSLKRFSKKLNDAGIGVGCHTFTTKIAKGDPYVTPVPDKRFWVDKETTLAGDIDEAATEIKAAVSIDQWPGSPVAKQKTWEGGVHKHRDVIIDDEIIQYESIDPETNTFLGCKRGAYGTHKAAHKAGTRSVHWGVDGCINGYIIDAETELIDEVAQNMADAFNECNFNMIYFDGGEDVDKRRRQYYTNLCEAKTVAKIKNRPYIYLGMASTNRMWNAETIGMAADTYTATLGGALISGSKIKKWKTVKEHINWGVRNVINAEKSLAQAELGWFGIWPEFEMKNFGMIEGLQFDQLEYLMVKSLAYNAPISMHTSFSQMAKHPLTPDILDMVGTYEKMRQDGSVDKATCQKLKEQNKDFAYIKVGDKGKFISVEEIPSVQGTHDIRAFAGKLSALDIAVNIWHYKGQKTPIEIAADNIQAYDVQGKPVKLEKTPMGTKIIANEKRLTLIFKSTTLSVVKNLLTQKK